MGRYDDKDHLLDRLASEPRLVRAALAVIERHLDNHAQPCNCRDTAKEVLSRGHYDAGGAISEECLGSDDPEQCEADRRQRHEQWNNLKSRVENGAMDWAEGKIRGALNIKPGAIAAMQGRALPAGAALAEEGAGALGMGAAAAAEGAEGLAGLAGLARFLPFLL